MAPTPGWHKKLASIVTTPAVKLLAKSHITPNAVTWFGFIITLGAAALIVANNLVAAGFVVLFAGFFDMLDGALARLTNQVSPFGAVLDSTLDRLSEAALLLGLLALIVFSQDEYLLGVLTNGWAALLVSLALLGSLMVSYVRARAEGIGIDCEVGILTRTERVVMFALGLLFSQISYVLFATLLVIMVLTFITTGQRLFHVWKHTRSAGN